MHNIAVLGLGSMGLKHAAAAIADGHNVVGYDPSTAALARLCEIGGRPVETLAAALQACSLVVIASPPAYHLAQAEAAIMAGKSVLVEKPLADRIGELENLVQIAEQNRLVFAVAQNLRYHPAVHAAREFIAAGAVGQPISVVSVGVSHLADWRPHQSVRDNYAADSRSGGVIFDWVHEIDMLVYLFGPFTPLAAVAERSGRLDIESEDTAALVLRHDKSGPLASINLSYLPRPRRRFTEIFGTEGRLELDLPGRALRRWDAGGDLVEICEFGGKHADDYVAELSAFLVAADGRGQVRCSARDALDVLRGVLALRQMAGLPAAGVA
ncbi:Gfo/Idh/MocA family oxidoreductase [Ferrovibrio sp.]|uniref:Gfo/Idh/MocA family protein n=1 Tax=Ferrovibrio sp. TaxID=1917215 RepID=UPI0025B929EE|nr:Gfo/Idh/MocA family oxidoreductase [Ferrovibrio sp.]MBX3456299.1 Gfo/Idh/MocA family oxidoreductase [Ferrovibrio sp.]